MKYMLIFWEMRDSSMRYDIPIPKGATPFARTAPSWKHAFPGTPEMHTIELMIHNQNTHHKLTIFT